MTTTWQGGRALVLGGGGRTGTAWMAGLAAGLRSAGVDLAEADLVVGTSAGAIVGAVLASGQHIARFGTQPPADADDTDHAVDSEQLRVVFTALMDTRVDVSVRRRRVGELAVAAKTRSEEAVLANLGVLLGVEEWPERALRITSVDTGSGEPVVWDRDSGVPLVPAVVSSMAMPGAFPPVTIDGRRYMDGGMRGGTNADVAAGARVLVVVAPLAHLFPRRELAAELEAAGAETVETVTPDDATLALLGAADSGLWDPAAWLPAYRAGERQAAQEADRLKAVWHG